MTRKKLRTRAREVVHGAGFFQHAPKTRDYPFWGDRFSAYRNASASDLKKARLQYIARFGKGSWNKDILPMIRGNKLNIYKKPRTKRGLYFINRTAWLSERRTVRSKKLGELVKGI